MYRCTLANPSRGIWEPHVCTCSAADLTIRIDSSNGSWYDKYTSVYFNAARSELGFTIRCVTAFLDLLQPITGDMVLQQAMDWAANRDVYVMQIKDEDHAYEVVEKATPIFEGFGVQLDTLMATC